MLTGIIMQNVDGSVCQFVTLQIEIRESLAVLRLTVQLMSSCDVLAVWIDFSFSLSVIFYDFC